MLLDWAKPRTTPDARGMYWPPPPIGAAPPRAALCAVLFNPVYKVAFIKNTKVGGTSLASALGGHCKPEMTFEEVQVCSLIPVQFGKR